MGLSILINITSRKFAIRITKTKVLFLISIGFLIVGCAGSTSTTTPVVVLPSPTTTADLRPTATSVPTVTPTPILIPTPAVTNHWKCYQGGIACYENLYSVSMFNTQAGWAGGILHYTAALGQSEPTWQVSGARIYASKVSVIGSDEWWGVEGGTLLHYKDGALVESSVHPEGVAHLYDLAVVAPDDVWTVGTEGSLLHHYQGEIERVEVSEKYDLTLIAMLNADEGWATGNILPRYVWDGPGNILLHYQQGEWMVMPLQAESNGRTYKFKAMTLLNNTEGWLVGDAVFHYQNGNWQEVPDVLEEEVVMTGISMVSPDEGWATTDQSYLLHYQQGQWQQVESPTQQTLHAINIVSAEEGWAVGDLNTVLHYHHGTWEVVSEGTKPPSLDDIDWIEDEGWAVGVNGKILHYQDGEWQPVDSPLEPHLGIKLTAVDMVSPEEGWAVGWGGVFLHYTQGVWQFTPNLITQGLSDLDMINENEGWAVGGSLDDGPIIAHYQDGVWSQVATPGKGYYLNAIDMVNEQEGWAVGSQGTILHYQSGTWQAIEPVVDDEYKDLFEIDMLNENEGWILAGNDLLLRYHNGGWQKMVTPQEYAPFSTIDLVGDQEGWLIGESIYHYRGGKWEIFNNPSHTGMAKILMLNENEGWAVGDGILHYTSEQ